MLKKTFSIILITLISLAPFADANDDVTKLTLEQAIEIGLKNSIQIQQVQNQIDIAALNKERAEFKANEIESGQHKLWDSQKKLYAAASALNTGMLPAEIQSQVSSAVTQGGIAISKGESTFSSALNDAKDVLSSKLGFSSMPSLNAVTTGSLMTAMADTQFDVTNASADIYRNQIALLIQKSYYDALQAQKILDVKKSAVERAKTQLEFSKHGFQEGMKAKDDMLLAETYYNSTLLELEKFSSDYDNTITELKKNIGISYDKALELTEVLVESPVDYDIKEGVLSGYKNRLEIKKALGQVMVYDLNFDIINKTEDPKTFQYREALMLKSKSKLELAKTQQDVEASIRSSYRTLQSTARMIETVNSMINSAKETLEIAQYKYKEGFSSDNSLLSKLNLQSASGTIVEVLAAEETLSDIESKRVQIIYGYNLAKMKYLNDIGAIVYK